MLRSDTIIRSLTAGDIFIKDSIKKYMNID